MTSPRTNLPGLEQSTLFDLESHTESEGAMPQFQRAVITSAIRRDRRDVFNASLLGGPILVGSYDIPRLDPCSEVPNNLISFSKARALRTPDPDAWVHF